MRKLDAFKLRSDGSRVCADVYYQGYIMGCRQAILEELAHQNIVISDDELELMLSCADPATLKIWRYRASVVVRVDEMFAPISPYVESFY